MKAKRPRDMNVIGVQVKKIRYERGWTQENLAGRCQMAGFDLSRTSLAMIESQWRGVSDKEVLKFAKVLKTTVAELFPKRK